MFSGISRRYDFLNHLLSLNRDRSWRRRTAHELAIEENDRILDACTGTGDLALEISQYVDDSSGGHVIGADFCPEMVSIGERKRLEREEKRCSLIVADTLNLPYADATFDAVTVAFGIRNLCDLEAGLLELRRVLKPGGRIALLEFTPPRGAILRSLFALYFRRILPLLGRIISRSSQGAEAYSYLPASVAEFPGPALLEDLLRETGFDSVRHHLMTAGIVALHLGHRAEPAGDSPEEEQAAGDCSLILSPSSSAPPEKIAEALEEHLGMHHSDAVARTRHGGGLLAIMKPRSRLEKLAATLASIGAPSSIAKIGELENLPRPLRTSGLEFSNRELTAASPGGKKTPVEKSRIAGIRIYALLPEAAPADKAEDGNTGPGNLQPSLLSQSAPGARPAAPQGRLAELMERLQDPELHGLSFHLALYCDSPPLALKIHKDEFVYSCLEENKSDNSLENYVGLLIKLLDWLGDIEGARQVEAFLEEPDPRSLLLSGENEAASFDRSFLWSLGVKTERDSSASAGGPETELDS